MADNEGFKMRDLVAKYAQSTAMHGLGNIQRTKTVKRKAFWAMLLLGGIGK